MEEHGYQRLVPVMKSVQCDHHFVISGVVKGGKIIGTTKNSALGKGVGSAQKALQGSEMEMRELQVGTK